MIEAVLIISILGVLSLVVIVPIIIGIYIYYYGSIPDSRQLIVRPLLDSNGKPVSRITSKYGPNDNAEYLTTKPPLEDKDKGKIGYCNAITSPDGNTILIVQEDRNFYLAKKGKLGYWDIKWNSDAYNEKIDEIPKSPFNLFTSYDPIKGIVYLSYKDETLTKNIFYKKQDVGNINLNDIEVYLEVSNDSTFATYAKYNGRLFNFFNNTVKP